MQSLESIFGAPVIEAYGMTEAAHQMTSNPLPPALYKLGTVGLAAGPEITILGPGDQLVEKGCLGEIIIRGTNVTPRYENNPEANQESFWGDWSRTSDEGLVDREGYLTITG
jgi:oxalate---CoA ligase